MPVRKRRGGAREKYPGLARRGEVNRLKSLKMSKAIAVVILVAAFFLAVLATAGYAYADRDGRSTIFVDIDIKPGSDPNSINMKSQGTIAVAILSSPTFDATTQLDKVLLLTFGQIGNEDSLAFCTKSNEDVNDDGLDDVVCHFRIQDPRRDPGPGRRGVGFQDGDTVGILLAQTSDGFFLIEGRDSVRILHG